LKGTYSSAVKSTNSLEETTKTIEKNNEKIENILKKEEDTTATA